jgi:GT2 family glycosyltransferase
LSDRAQPLQRAAFRTDQEVAMASLHRADAVRTSQPTPRVAICIASYRRPEGLCALLRSIDALVFEGAPPQLRVIVADNDAAESARAVCDAARDWLRYPLTYAIERRRGIPQARNASLAAALGQVEWIAFVDDDQRVDPHWLDRLLRTQRESGAAVVAGPILPDFPVGTPQWVAEGEFFTCPDPHYPPPAVAYTGNALVSESVLAGMSPLFDERLSRGEDIELFGRIAHAGHRIVWATDAQAFHLIAPERTRLAWIVARAYANARAGVQIDLAQGRRGRAAIALRGVRCLVEGLICAALPGRRGRAARARALQRAAVGLGQLLGLAAR